MAFGIDSSLAAVYSDAEDRVSFESGVAALSSAIIGVGLLGYGLHLRSKLRACQGWPEATGMVTQSAVEVDDGYEVRVVYEYSVNGVGYSGSRIQFGSQTSYLRKGRAEAAVSRYPVNSHVTVYYDPENPAEAVLDRTSPSGLEYMVIGIVCLVMMVLVILYPAHGTTET